MAEFLISLLVFLIGISIGSFAYAFALRLPTGKPWIFDRSHCDKCGSILSWRELLPLASFIFQRGRCLNCRKFIGWSYPLSELVFAFSFLWLWETKFLAIMDFIWLSFWIFFFFVISIIDLKHLIIPDKLILFGTGAVILELLLKFGAKTFLINNILTAALSCGAFFLLWFFSGGRWLGFGDVKFIFLIGLLFGFPATIWIIYIAVAVGVGAGLFLILFKNASGKTPLPLGTFLSLASIFYILFNDSINSFFLKILL